MNEIENWIRDGRDTPVEFFNFMVDAKVNSKYLENTSWNKWKQLVEIIHVLIQRFLKSESASCFQQVEDANAFFEHCVDQCFWLRCENSPPNKS